MSAIARVRSLALTDMRLIVRDRFLLGSVVYIFALTFILRLSVPALSARLMRSRGFDLEPYYALIASFTVIMCGAVLVGTLIGFVFLEAREEGTLKALLVSPMALEAYLAYRIATPMVLAWVVIPLIAWLLGFGAPPLYALLPIAFVGSLIGGIATLFVPTFADNKVQAFATMKILGGSVLIPLGAFFIEEPWQYIAGLFPPYWVFKAYWAAAGGDPAWWLHLCAGAALLAGLLWLLVRRLQVEAYR